jgi:hypothetical protein
MNDDMKQDLNDALHHSKEAARSMMKAMRDALDVAINALDRNGKDDEPVANAPDKRESAGAGEDVTSSRL